jgi:hypothetical protein
MSADLVTCPDCGSERIRYREHRDDWFCDDCDHRWTVDSTSPPAADSSKPLLFLSYGRRDATDLAERLKSDLEAHGYRVWMDTREIRAAREWEHQIEDGLRSAQVFVAVLTPHAVRRSNDPSTPDMIDSVCLDEISFARFAQPPTAVVPVMGQMCEPPFSIFRLDYVDMCAWRDAEDQYQAGLQRLLTAIESALGGKVAYRRQINDLQPWDFAAFLHEKRRDFCGREWLFREIDLWLTTNNEPALMITGDPGTGKSALVAELVHRNPGGQVLAYHCCQADVLATVEPARFVRSIAAMIASQLAGYAARLQDPAVKNALAEEACAIDPFSTFDAGVLTPLQGLPAPDREARYLLIDGLDEALPHGGQSAQGTIVDLLSAFIERLPGWLRIVATTRNEPAVLHRLAGLRAREIAAQDPRNIDDVEHYLRQQLETPNLSQQLTEAGQSLDAAVATLRNRCGGSFLYATQVCTGLERGMYHLSNLDALPPGLSGHYRKFFHRQFPNAARFEGVRPVLEALVVADTPLAIDALASASGTEPRHDLPAALRSLGAFVIQDESGFRLFHKSLTDWLTDSSRIGEDFYIDQFKGRRRLSQAISATIAANIEAVPPKSALLRQLVSTAEWQRFDELIDDWSFVRPFGAANWAVLYPELVQTAGEAQADHLRKLPLALINVGWGRAEIEDLRNAVFMFHRAFAAIMGLANRDRSRAPWLREFLTDLTNLRDAPKGIAMAPARSDIMARFFNHVALIGDNMTEVYMCKVQNQWAEALKLLERVDIAVPPLVREWNDQIQRVR